MSEYRNFNNYEIEKTEPQTVTAQDGSGAPVPGTPAQGGTDGFGLASVILAPLGCCCSGIPAVVGLILGIIGRKKNRSSALSLIGIVLCAVVIAYIIYSMVYMQQHPEEYQAAMEEIMNMMEQMSGTAGKIGR